MMDSQDNILEQEKKEEVVNQEAQAPEVVTEEVASPVEAAPEPESSEISDLP